MSSDSRLLLRKARKEDSRELWRWRNDKATRKNSFNQHPIPWTDHRKWFDQSLARRDRKIYIATRGGQKLAMVRFDFPEAKIAEVSINVHPEHRGKGLGKIVLKKACALMAKGYPARVQKAFVRRDNRVSEKVFMAAGFFKIHRTEKAGYSVWIKKKKYSSSKAK